MYKATGEAEAEAAAAAAEAAATARGHTRPCPWLPQGNRCEGEVPREADAMPDKLQYYHEATQSPDALRSLTRKGVGVALDGGTRGDGGTVTRRQCGLGGTEAATHLHHHR